jgi:hypothetical protein
LILSTGGHAAVKGGGSNLEGFPIFPPTVRSRRPVWLIPLTATFSDPIAQGNTVWATTNLASPLQSWMNIGSGTFGFDPVDFDDSNTLNFLSRFYRITCP